MRKLFFLIAVLVMTLSACVQNNGKPMPKVGDKKYYDVTNITPEGEKKLSLVMEVTAVNDSSITITQTYTYPNGEKISNSYTSHMAENEKDSDVPMKSIFAKHLVQFGDSLEFVEGTEFARYKNDLNEKAVFDPARMVLKYAANGSEQTIVLSVEERTVHGKEKLTTPAGTFECIKFSENHVAKIGDEEFFTQLVCWYDLKDGGQVKQIDLTKNGDMVYCVELIKVE